MHSLKFLVRGCRAARRWRICRYNDNMGDNPVTPEGPEKNQLAAAVGRARSRFVANQALREAALAATIALLGPTLLLLLGRDLFAWPLLAILAAGGAGLAAWRLRKRRPDLYQIAQVLDARLAVEDQISTAVYFLEAPQPVAIEQRRTAARVIARSDPDAAFPFTMPRAAYGLASIFLLASGLFALRYFLEKPLRLEQPLPSLIAQAMRGGESPQRERLHNQEKEAREAQRKQAKAGLDNQGLGNRSNFHRAVEVSEPGQNETAAAGDSSKASNDKRDQKEGAPTGDEIAEQMKPGAENDAIQSYEEMLERDAKSGLEKAQGKQDKDAEGKGENKSRPGSQGASDSLLAKLREAMNNMMSRLQQRSPSAGDRQQATPGSSGDSRQQQEGGGDGRPGEGQAKPGGQNATDSEGGESPAKGGAPQKAAGDTGGKSTERGEGESGAGDQDGEKGLRDAEREQALGKLSELFGRRAANVTGEVTVEAESGKQTLRTPQSPKQASHNDAGGEISRDEIPLAYQPFVKEYFNRIRQADKK